MKKEEGKMLEKQADDFEAAITKGIKETTMQHVKRYGRTSAMAISVSLARSFAASMAVLTQEFPKKERKKVLDWFFENIKEEALQLDDDIAPKDLSEALSVNKQPS